MLKGWLFYLLLNSFLFVWNMFVYIVSLTCFSNVSQLRSEWIHRHTHTRVVLLSFGNFLPWHLNVVTRKCCCVTDWKLLSLSPEIKPSSWAETSVSAPTAAQKRWHVTNSASAEQVWWQMFRPCSPETHRQKPSVHLRPACMLLVISGCILIRLNWMSNQTRNVSCRNLIALCRDWFYYWNCGSDMWLIKWC